jgi:15-cis-phytoene synthase
MGPIAKSYEYCRQVARSRARNFYYSFVLLPKPQKNAICAMYAFMRYCDDLSDEPAVQADAARLAIERWRSDLDRALAGEFGAHPVWPAFHDAVQRYKIPHEYFYEMIEGVASDIDPRTIRNFDKLYRYCYQVASVVGMTVIHMFGFRSQEALPLAEKCGVAFQLTNILRDIREDAERGRVYLPQEDLERFGVDPEAFRNGTMPAGFTELMKFEAERARAYYDASKPLIGMVEPSSRSSLWALIEIYSRLLDKIERSHFDVLSHRVQLSSREKAGIVVRAALGHH